MSEKPMSFSKFMEQLNSAEVVITNAGIEFLTTSPDGLKNPFVALTPCLNIRNKNFIALFKDAEAESMNLGSLYIAEDCPAIFDKTNRSDFFQTIRRGVQSLAPNTTLVSYANNGLNLTASGDRTRICMGPVIMMEFQPIDVLGDNAEYANYVDIRYRSTNYHVTSTHFQGVSYRNRRLFALSLVGNVYAKSKADTYA